MELRRDSRQVQGIFIWFPARNHVWWAEVWISVSSCFLLVNLTHNTVRSCILGTQTKQGAGTSSTLPAVCCLLPVGVRGSHSWSRQQSAWFCFSSWPRWFPEGWGWRTACPSLWPRWRTRKSTWQPVSGTWAACTPRLRPATAPWCSTPRPRASRWRSPAGPPPSGSWSGSWRETCACPRCWRPRAPPGYTPQTRRTGWRWWWPGPWQQWRKWAAEERLRLCFCCSPRWIPRNCHSALDPSSGGTWWVVRRESQKHRIGFFCFLPSKQTHPNFNCEKKRKHQIVPLIDRFQRLRSNGITRHLCVN